jgi:hypothetical protein
VTEAAPRPLSWFEDESTLHWIAVHLAEFLDPLLFREYNEVVEARLPDASLGQSCAPQAALARVDARTKLSQKASGESLFKGLHHERRMAALRFAEQEMHRAPA